MPSARAAARRVLFFHLLSSTSSMILFFQLLSTTSSKFLFFQFLSGASRAAGLGDAVRTRLCSQHDCVRASKNLLCRLPYTPSCFAGLGALHVHHACHTPACVRASISSSTTSRQAGFVNVRHARHICVCVGKYFQLCPSTGWRWRSSGVPCSPHKCVRATISGCATSTESWPWCSACAPCSLLILLRVGKQTFLASLLRSRSVSSFTVSCVSWRWRSPRVPNRPTCGRE